MEGPVSQDAVVAVDREAVDAEAMAARGRVGMLKDYRGARGSATSRAGEVGAGSSDQSGPSGAGKQAWMDGAVSDAAAPRALDDLDPAAAARAGGWT